MSQIALQIPQSGALNATEDPKIASDMTMLQNVINGGIDATNISASLAQAALVNYSGVTVKGATNISTAQSTSSTSYTTLATPDQVAGVTLNTNGLIAVWFQGTWQSSIATAGEAAIFLNTSQVQVVNASASTGPIPQSASTGSTAATNGVLASFSGGLTSTTPAGGYTGDVTTGQIVAAESTGSLLGGPCWIFAAAGTYTVAVKFLATTGSVTASNRKLWVAAFSFA